MLANQQALKALRVQLPQLRRAGGVLMGLHSSRKRGSSTEINPSTPYQTGDDTRRIDYRTTARTSELYVRRFEPEVDAKVWVVVDGSLRQHDAIGIGNRRTNFIREVGASLAFLSMIGGDRVGLIYFGSDGRPVVLPPKAGPRQFAEIDSRLESCCLTREDAFGRLISRIPANRHSSDEHVVIISDFLAPGWEEALTNLRKHQQHVLALQVLDPFDIQVDEAMANTDQLRRTFQFVAADGSRRRFNLRRQADRDEYNQMAERNIARVNKAMGGTPLVTLTTDHDVITALATQLQPRLKAA